MKASLPWSVLSYMAAYAKRQQTLTLLGDNIEQVPTWVELERKAEELCVNMAEQGGRPELVWLADHDMPNHSHMMMMDFGNEDILQWIVHWVDSRLG